MKSFIMFSLIALVGSEVAVGQRLTPKSPFILNIDYARFKNNDSTGYLELYFLFYPGLVTMEANGEGEFAGKIFVSITARDSATGNLYVNEVRALPVSIRDTAQVGASNTLVSLASYVLSHGFYDFRVVAKDSIEPARADSLSLLIAMTPLVEGPTTSDLELCSRIVEASGQGSFVKNTLEVVPNATLMFGATNHPVVFHYVELYGLQAQRPYTIASSIIDAQGTQLRSTSRDRSFTVPDVVDVGTMNVSKLPSGRYQYRLEVLRDSVISVTRTQKTFYVYNPHIQAETVSSESLMENELSGLDFEELGEEFESAKYLATAAEIAAFAKLTTVEGRRKFLSTFWVDVGQGKGGREPMARPEYTRRVQTAMQRYRLHNRAGWKTDRGRVYLLNGDPDEIERVPSDEDVKPYEIWHYYQVENGVDFVFVDRTGFGDYQLVHSTKRGELQDATWQRTLR